MKKIVLNVTLLVMAVLAMILSIWGPEALTVYRDKGILDVIQEQEIENEGVGYRYQLSNNEKLYILSEALNSQSIPETEQSALTRKQEESGYAEGAYAFVVNHQGPSGREITDEEIYEACNEQIAFLTEEGILPAQAEAVEGTIYDATLYSAIDVLEPGNNVAVWKLNIAANKKNISKQNRLLDAYIDADSGKIYEFYVRTEAKWEEINPDELAEKWAGYIGLYGMEEYETENPLLETTPYYKKYVFPGMGEEKAIVTVGFYEGINELFLKISR